MLRCRGVSGTGYNEENNDDLGFEERKICSTVMVLEKCPVFDVLFRYPILRESG